MRALTLTLLAVPALALAACGSDEPRPSPPTNNVSENIIIDEPDAPREPTPKGDERPR